MSSSLNISYFFRSVTSQDIALAEKGLLPKDYFYYYHYLRRYFSLRAVSLAPTLFNPLLSRVNDKLLRTFLGFDFPLLPTLGQLHQLKRSDFIFATTPKIGIAVAFLKHCKLMKCKLVINIVGLYEQLNKLPPENIGYKLIVRLLKQVDVFVSGANRHEALMLANLLKFHKSKFRFIPHSGIDTKYFNRGNTTSKEDFILGIGVDPSRDWNLYRQVAEELPQEKFIWATDPKLVNQPFPMNVKVAFFSTPQLREKILQAKLVLILTKANHHFSGQASAMRAMSCGKAVILTKTAGVEEFPLKHLHNCILVKPGDVSQVIYYINKLSHTPILTKRIADNAAHFIRQYYSYSKIGQQYVKLFKSVSSS